MMKPLNELPNIGSALANKLNKVGINNAVKLLERGSETTLIKIATLENSGACINMLYALERWRSGELDGKI